MESGGKETTVTSSRRIRMHPRLATALGLATALLLTLGSTPATPEGRIVLHGTASGSQLTLTARGGDLVVHGWMAPAPGAGCHLAQSRDLAVCPLDRAGRVEVNMGRSGDFVEVLNKLPVPLTVRLGGGSDKFIGSGEADTCYP
jgi:hypothetical protein